MPSRKSLEVVHRMRPAARNRASIPTASMPGSKSSAPSLARRPPGRRSFRRQIKKENARLLIERNILKNSAAYFARDQM